MIYVVRNPVFALQEFPIRNGSIPFEKLQSKLGRKEMQNPQVLALISGTRVEWLESRSKFAADLVNIFLPAT